MNSRDKLASVPGASRIDEVLNSFFGGQQRLQPTVTALDRLVRCNPASAVGLLEALEERRRSAARRRAG